MHAAAQKSAAADSLTAIRSGFATPPMDARPMMRWWWFGPAVEKNELAREMRTMKAGGIGGVEVQPVYALELDDPQKGFRNLPFLSKDFLDMVGFTAQTAHDLNLRLSMTLGSGWPYGGAYVPVSDAAGQLRIVADVVPPDAYFPSRSFDSQWRSTAGCVHRAGNAAALRRGARATARRRFATSG